MSDIKSPDSIIRELTELKNESARIPKIIRDYETKAKEATRVYLQQYAMEYGRANGSVEDRKQHAIAATIHYLEEKDNAEIALSYAKNQFRRHESDQSNLQTQAKHVELTFRMAGVGER